MENYHQEAVKKQLQPPQTSVLCENKLVDRENSRAVAVFALNHELVKSRRLISNNCLLLGQDLKSSFVSQGTIGWLVGLQNEA